MRDAAQPAELARTGDEVRCPVCGREYQRSLKGLHNLLFHSKSLPAKPQQVLYANLWELYL